MILVPGTAPQSFWFLATRCGIVPHAAHGRRPNRGTAPPQGCGRPEQASVDELSGMTNGQVESAADLVTTRSVRQRRLWGDGWPFLATAPVASFIQIERCKRSPLLIFEWLKFNSSHAAKSFATQTEDPSIINNPVTIGPAREGFSGWNFTREIRRHRVVAGCGLARYAPFEADREMAAALDQQGRRRFAGLEARALGRGDVNLVKNPCEPPPFL
jgi:hypothetical protein